MSLLAQTVSLAPSPRFLIFQRLSFAILILPSLSFWASLIREMSAPFNVCLLSGKDPNTVSPGKDPSTGFPATYRSDKGQITALTAGSLQFFEKELGLDELNKIQDALWAAGLPTPPRHLAHQIVLSREIVITEQIGLHLVWKDKRMYLKPLSKYLLVPSTWSQHFKSQQGDDQQTTDHRQALAACARGFLHSYCALIAYESDFRRIFRDVGLDSKRLVSFCNVAQRC